MQTSNYDAEFGRSASATINVVTRSGGDQYHGGGFEFVQNNIFNAENPGTKLTNPTAKGYCGRAAISLQRLWMGPWRPHSVYPAERQAVFLCRARVEEVSRGIPGIDGCVGSRDVSHGDGGGEETSPTSIPAGPGLPGIALKTPAVIPASCSGGVLYTAPNVINPAVSPAMARLLRRSTRRRRNCLSGEHLPTSTGCQQH